MCGGEQPRWGLQGRGHEEGAGATAVDERRAEPAGAGKSKRQAVLATRFNVEIIDVDADGGAPSRADAVAPFRVRAGTQCEGRCIGGARCEVRSVGGSAPTWLSAPLRSGGRFCTTHTPHRVAARAAKAAAKAAATQRQQATAQGVQRVGAARRAASENRSTAGMAAALMAAARGGA